jgi:hypothetical protein
MSVQAEDFRQAIRALHRVKDASYRNAWKKRGEVLSILANIARKVDRLEYAFDQEPKGGDESLFDTAIDLFVYSLKYETFLADLDASVALTLFDRCESPPYSDGVAGFEYLLSQVDLPAVDPSRITPKEAQQDVLKRFNELEGCFSGTAVSRPAGVRLHHVIRLVEATNNLIAALKRDATAYTLFLAAIQERCP